MKTLKKLIIRDPVLVRAIVAVVSLCGMLYIFSLLSIGLHYLAAFAALVVVYLYTNVIEPKIIGQKHGDL